MTLTLDQNGYIRINLWKEGRRYPKKVHRLVLITFIGPPGKGMETRHLDGNRTNNYLSNLKWGTKKDNYTDKIIHGTKQIGILKRISTCQKRRESPEYPLRLFETNILFISNTTLSKMLSAALSTLL